MCHFSRSLLVCDQIILFFVLPENGDLYSWGHGGYGQLGHADIDKSAPVLVKSNLGDRKVTQVACGSYHSLALTANGEVSRSIGLAATSI